MPSIQNEPIRIPSSPYSGIIIEQKAYALSNLEFERINSNSVSTSQISLLIFSLIAGYGINIIEDKPLFLLEDKSINLPYIIILSGLFLAFIIYIIGIFIPNNKSKTINKIKKFFEEGTD